ncbi:MAG: hypothetical protein R3F37_06990 [Candidatus Competibacteraceae bacterium]
MLFPMASNALKRAGESLAGCSNGFLTIFTFALRQELHLAKTRIKYRLWGSRFEGQNELLVNLGCGSTGRVDWVNVDMYAGPNVNLVYDLRKHVPLPDGSAKGIFGEHFLEHLEYSERSPSSSQTVTAFSGRAEYCALLFPMRRLICALLHRRLMN